MRVCYSARELWLGGGNGMGKARGVLKKPESYPFSSGLEGCTSVRRPISKAITRHRSDYYGGVQSLSPNIFSKREKGSRLRSEQPGIPAYLRHDKNGPGPAGFGKTNVQGVATITALAVSKNLTPVCGPGIPSYCSSKINRE